MYLSELVIINYRSCRNLYIKLDNDYPNVLIGINDCGKSSILQAIGLLLNPKAKFYFANDDKMKNDISNTPLTDDEFKNFLGLYSLPLLPYQPQQSVFIGKFFVETADINLIANDDDNISNHLKWVIEKSSDNSLWFAKIFDGKKQSFTSYLLTQENENDSPSALYKQNAVALNKVKRELNITSDEINNANDVGRFKNIELVNAIYKKFKLKPVWAEYVLEKNFWPEYRYLDWNFTLEELNQFANDLLKQNIAPQMDMAASAAKSQASQAQVVVNQELIKLASFLKEDLQNINIKAIQANVNFQVNSFITDIMVDKENSDGPIHLDSQGDGIKRQLWFSLLKWKALKDVEVGIKDTKFIWCFDEPETHLYPKAQRDFFELIKKISLTNVQSLISTHSTIFIDRAKLGNINKVDLIKGYTIFNHCDDVDDIYHSLQIKNSDFLFYDKFLVVEGDTEQAIIPFLYNLHFGKTLNSDSIQLINLGGKDKRHANQKILKSIIEGFRKETNSKIIYMFDNDAITSFTRSEIEGINHIFVGKQDIEDSIESSLWLSLLMKQTKNQLSITIEEIDQIKNSIPDAKSSQVLQSNQKFYGKLKNLVYQKAKEAGLPIETFTDCLPAKGLDSGKLLAEHIDSLKIAKVEHISVHIQKAFEQLVL